MRLRRKLNYRLIDLCGDTTNELVGVRLVDGDYKFLPFSGFIDYFVAKGQKVRPVKLQVYSYSCDEFVIPHNWKYVENGKHLLGCVILGRAYCIIKSGKAVEV